MTDPTKVEAVEEWPVPKSIKQLKAFLGLIVYNKRLVKDYGHSIRPLLDILKV